MTVRGFLQLLHEKTGVAPDSAELLCGFPPKQLQVEEGRGGAEKGVWAASYSGLSNHLPTTSQLPCDLDASLLADLGLSNGDTFTLRASETATLTAAAAAALPSALAAPLAATPASVTAATQATMTALTSASPPAPTLPQAAPLMTAPQGGGSQAAPVTALARSVMVRVPRCTKCCSMPPLAAADQEEEGELAPPPPGPPPRQDEDAELAAALAASLEDISQCSPLPATPPVRMRMLSWRLPLPPP